jgi:4-methyl-5(b-hydroxyethyl)-thiazole monophosphate biosynthesis
MKSYVFLAEGFEITEALATVDVLRRGKINTLTVSISDSLQVTASNQTTVIADLLFDKQPLDDADLIVLPGGMPGTINLGKYQPLLDLVLQYHQEGKLIAAICAAPTIFGKLGLLNGKHAVCYPGMEEGLTGAIVTNQGVVRDGNIITAKGMGVSQHFGVALLEALTDCDTARQVARAAIID